LNALFHQLWKRERKEEGKKKTPALIFFYIGIDPERKENSTFVFEKGGRRKGERNDAVFLLYYAILHDPPGGGSRGTSLDGDGRKRR